MARSTHTYYKKQSDGSWSWALSSYGELIASGKGCRTSKEANAEARQARNEFTKRARSMVGTGLGDELHPWRNPRP